MVLDDEALDRLWQAEDGILAGARPPAVWVDCSTVSPAASRARSRAAAASRGTAFVCAPVSGNPCGRPVREPDLRGVRAAAQRSPWPRRCSRDIGRGVHVVGAAHEARVVKLGTNLVLAVLAQALAEALVLGQSHGVRRAALMEFINDSAIGSPFTRYKTDAFVRLDLDARVHASRASARTSGSPLQLGAEHEVPMPVSSATEVEFSRLVASGLGDGPRLRLADPAGRPRRRDRDRAGTRLTATGSRNHRGTPRRYPGVRTGNMLGS